MSLKEYNRRFRSQSSSFDGFLVRLARRRHWFKSPAVVSRWLLLPVSVLPVSAVVCTVLLFAPAGASASLPEVIKTNMPAVVEWVYRNAAVEDPLACAEVCKKLWTAEQASGSASSQRLWDMLGELETSLGLWGKLSEIRSLLGEMGLGPVPLRLGVEFGYGAGSPKWMATTGPVAPSQPSGCGIWGTRFNTTGGEVNPTNGQEIALSPGNEWYLVLCGVAERISDLAAAMNPENPGYNCNGNGRAFSGWVLQEWGWEECDEGNNKGVKVYAHATAQAFYQPFHFSRPEDYTGQELKGEYAHNVGLSGASDPGTAKVTAATEGALESSSVPRTWLIWVLEGESGASPLSVSPEEEYGSGSEASPHKTPCLLGKPVNCATGNETENQTDLRVGGRGPGLSLTRTYNSQLAAKQSSPGPFGYGWSAPYSAHVEISGELATVYQSDGSTVRFLASGEQWVPAAPLVQATLAKEGSGYKYTLPDQTVLHFNSSGQLTSETDRNGNTLTMSYESKGRLESVSDPAGRKLTFAYNSEGFVESAKDPMGHTVKYTYEGKSLASVTQPAEVGLRWKFKYDGSHQMTEMVDGRGHAVTTEYDGSHRVIVQTDALSRKRTWKYGTITEGTYTEITEPNGSVTREEFNVDGLPSKVTRAYGTSLANSTSSEYDALYNLIATTDPSGHKTQYEYNAAGDRTGETDANNNERNWVYDAQHNLISVTTPKGETTTIKRDSHGNPETIERPAPSEKTQTTKYKYGTNGDLENVTDPLERTWKYEYDTYGDRATEIDPAGNKRTWAYNEDSQETSTVSPRGNVTGGKPTEYTTKIERDVQGRPLTVTDPLSHTTKYTYDGNGNIETLTDGNSHKTTYTYNADNQPIKVKAPSGATTETEYDGAGRVISQTDGNKHTTKYIRNAVGEVTEVIDPLGRKTIKEYDATGNLKTLKDPATRTTTYTYDPGNRLTEVSYSDGKTPAAKYEYDADGDRTSMIDGTGTTSYTFDQLDRLTESKDGHGDKTSYEYDLGNQKTKITYPNGKSVTRAFDKAGRLEKVTDWLSNVTKFAYDVDSDLTTTTFPTATTNVDKYVYNRADQMTEDKMTKGAETLVSLVYTRDNVGQLKKATSKGLPGTEVTEYTYDGNNRLTKAGTTAYEYDAANNPTKEGSSTNTFDIASELEKGTAFNYTYDQLGERTKTTPTTGPATTYGYDQAGNPISVERPKEGSTEAITDTYAYDGNGLRASQTISGTTTYLTWDMTKELPLILNDSANSYIYGPGGLPIEQITSAGAITYLHHDQQGSTRLLTGSTGTVTGSTTFDAYGNKTGSTGTSTTPLGYDAQYTSSDTGLVYLRARVYDPATAQFLSVDPLLALTRAPYNYSRDNPLNQRDPSGLVTVGICVSGEIALGIRIGGGVCGQVSSSGEVGATGTINGGVASGAGASAGIGVQSSTAEHIAELGGPFAHLGGSIHAGGGVSADTFFGGADACGNRVSGGEISLGVGAGADQYGGVSETETIAIGL